MATVKNTWLTENSQYRYILADYNGENGDTNATQGLPKVNIDYMVPSVNVAWLWDKIFSFYQIGYNGSIFETTRFKDLWMTYPKGTVIGDEGLTIFKSEGYTFVSPSMNSKWQAKFSTTVTNLLPETKNNIHLKVNKTAAYMLRVKGTLYGQNTQQEPVSSKLALVKNQQDNYYLSGYISDFMTIWDDQPYGEEKEVELGPFNLADGDYISLYARKAANSGNLSYLTDSRNKLEVQLYRVEPATIDFSAAFTDFSIKDFLNEVVQRFGLTFFKDKYSLNYTFLTLREHLLDGAVQDWSDTFIKKVSENYIYGSYAQRNYFRYSYNDKESSHNDWYIDVANVNLPESKDLIKSKIYSPEKLTTQFLNDETHIYRMWDKEIKDNPDDPEPVAYKSLDKRYYFMRSVLVSKPIELRSAKLAQSDPSVTSYYRESYAGLQFYDILQEYYQPIRKILDKAIIVTADLLLKDTDIANFDFRKRYYIEQLGGNFIVNKISNYISGKPVRCELINVDSDPEEGNELKITKVVTVVTQVKVYYQSTNPVTGVIIEYMADGGGWVSLPWQGTSPATFMLPAGNYILKLRAGTEVSNTVTVRTPSNRVTEI